MERELYELRRRQGTFARMLWWITPDMCEQATKPTSESIQLRNRPITIAERDAMLIKAWKDREGSLANAQFEDGKVEEGYRRHVVRPI